jgi:catechol 2,3-dioxygenase-like lactoylglutathione lyase family enzyme
MAQMLSAVTLVVPDYDAALAYYVGVMGFELVDDSKISETKRWILVRPPGARETCLLLAKADGEDQQAAIGNQTGGRVFLFLATDSFSRDHAALISRGVTFLEEPRHEAYGTVAVFRDAFGNLWDLIQRR